MGIAFAKWRKNIDEKSHLVWHEGNVNGKSPWMRGLSRVEAFYSSHRVVNPTNRLQDGTDAVRCLMDAKFF
jgi:hypothetical protein